jgi:hypothetical protein
MSAITSEQLFRLAADYIPMAVDVEVAAQGYIERVLRQL